MLIDLEDMLCKLLFFWPQEGIAIDVKGIKAVLSELRFRCEGWWVGWE
jgi:hypothetical protein